MAATSEPYIEENKTMATLTNYLATEIYHGTITRNMLVSARSAEAAAEVASEKARNEGHTLHFVMEDQDVHYFETRLIYTDDKGIQRMHVAQLKIQPSETAHNA
jgi:hypothetical protein